ncbi:DUF5590 domain-containing protein [Streptococcus sp. oral taxon 061]|uniref:cell wall elongation regulator TseB-like domain-containing protein n=1 Tax=Streptococcus sp. oral taxon 061 TaxID=712623 RepID=UPI0034D4202D
MKKRQKKEKNSLLSQYIIGITLLTLVITSSFLYLVWISMKPYQTAKVEGERLAKQYASLETVSQVDIFNGLESYYSVLGQDKNQKPVAVLIEKSSNNIYVYQLENGTSQEKAEAVVREKGATEIDKITFGRYADKPVWEIKSGGDYYLVDFESGDLVEKEKQ